MIFTGISYMIMGSLYFLKEPLKLNLNHISMKIYRALFMTGMIIFILSIIKLIFPSHLWYIPLGGSVMFLGYYTIKLMKNWMIAIEVMNKLNDENEV